MKSEFSESHFFVWSSSAPSSVAYSAGLLFCKGLSPRARSGGPGVLPFQNAVDIDFDDLLVCRFLVLGGHVLADRVHDVAGAAFGLRDLAAVLHVGDVRVCVL